MDLLPTETLKVIVLSFKTLFLIMGVILVLINYFHSKEAKKMERKLSVGLPGSVTLAMSLQLLFSVAFLFAATILLFLF